MKAISSFSKEFKKIQELPFQKKMEFIWDYYKWHILITLFLLISVIATAVSVSNNKDVILSGYLFDSYYSTDQDEPFYDYLSYADADSTSQTGEFFTNLSLYGMYTETAQQFYSTVAAGQTDFVVASPQTFLRLCYDSFDYFFDLREILSQEQLEQLSDRLFYVDASMLDQLDDQEGVVRLPDHDKPEEMTEPVPIGIDIRGCRGIDALYPGEDPVYFAVINNAPHYASTLKFLDYLFSNDG